MKRLEDHKANKTAKLESSSSDESDGKEITIFNMKINAGKTKRALLNKSKSVLPDKIQNSDKLEVEAKEETTDGDNTSEFESVSSSSHESENSESCHKGHCASTLNLDESMRMNESFERVRNILVAQKEKEKIKENTMKDVLVIEQDYLKNEQLEISMDVYNIFIAANITKNCNPVELGYCLQKVILVFMVQILISIGFMWEYLTLDRF